ncbi:hypothetical protein TWF191_002505 [Orbilia oligospora]|uniref:Uncharacterized protein n=1 Tax=Orbilia oligospora TaxID=2813651 RepID=A0A7C8R378_ORBOL|nr:hypothetical protein TWF191_002505 [Orbilia oligospora]
MRHQSSALILLFFFFFSCIPKVLAVEWDDFADNFATDLAPLITLFGEQVTRQFLSESLSIWDNIIFAMAPLGLLTAVVSVIRVCGSASLRAFIGRAQESSGFAEIEVLSCTSATTGELFNARGGIARVFGSPQILEVVVTKPNDPDKPEFEVTTLQNAKKSWVKVEPRRGGNNRQEKADTTEELEALLDNLECQPSYRSPNLSLNVGIAKIPQEIIYLAAVFGMVLQAGVLIFAILTTHPKFVHRFTDPEENGPRPSYGLPFTLVGTILNRQATTYLNQCHYKESRSRSNSGSDSEEEEEDKDDPKLMMESVPALRSQVLSNFREISLEELQDDTLLDVRSQLAQLAKWPNFEVRNIASSLKSSIDETLVRTINGSDIGGTTEVRPIVNQEDAVLLQNTVVEAITDLFHSSGLGTREDAYMCIFPVLRRTNKMPPASGVETAAIDRAEAYRGQGKWSKAFEILEWLCYDRLQPTAYKPVSSWYNSPRAEISLGDLCYAAIREKEDGIIRLGFESICRMLQSNIDPEFGRQYGQIGLQVCKDHIHDSPVFEEYYSLLRSASVDLKSFEESDEDLDPLSPHRLDLWAYRGQVAAVRYFLGRGLDTTDINAVFDGDPVWFTGRTAIYNAVCHEHIDMVHILLTAGASIGIQDYFGDSPSFIAASLGYSEILEMLIRYDLNAVRRTSIGRDGLSLLMIAAKNGHVECVQQILKALPLCVNSRSRDGDNALGIACEGIVEYQFQGTHGQKRREGRDPQYGAVIEALLEHGCDARNRNKNGRTALHIVARNGSELAASLILDSGVAIDLNAQDPGGNTPLHFAMTSEKIVELLIKAGANPTIRNKDGDTALVTAIKAGLSPTNGNVLALFTSDIERHEHEFILDALIVAACRGDSDMVSFLLGKRWRLPFSGPELKKILLAGRGNGQNGVTSIDATILKQIGKHVTWNLIRDSEDHDEALPISVLATDEGSTDLLSLNQNGYVVYHNIKDEYDRTALHFAAEYAMVWLTSELIRKGASLLARDSYQSTPLHYAGGDAWTEASEDEISSMLELLCGKGTISVDHHDMNKSTPLYCVIGRFGHRNIEVFNTCQEKLAKRLLKMGANPDGFEGGACPLQAAVRRNKIGIVQLLLEEYKADANYCPEGFKTLLHQAAVDETDIQIMETLLKHGADVNATLEDRATPLTYALSIYHSTSDRFYQSGASDAIERGLVFSRIKTLLNYGARVTGISYCIGCTAGNGLLGEFVDDLLSPQNSTLLCREDKRLPQAMKLLLAGWKNENPGKTKEDAMKDLGGQVAWEKGRVWEDYEDINLRSLGVLPKSLFEAPSNVEPPDQSVEGSLS